MQNNQEKASTLFGKGKANSIQAIEYIDKEVNREDSKRDCFIRSDAEIPA